MAFLAPFERMMQAPLAAIGGASSRPPIMASPAGFPIPWGPQVPANAIDAARMEIDLREREAAQEMRAAEKEKQKKDKAKLKKEDRFRRAGLMGGGLGVAESGAGGRRIADAPEWQLAEYREHTRESPLVLRDEKKPKKAKRPAPAQNLPAAEGRTQQPPRTLPDAATARRAYPVRRAPAARGRLTLPMLLAGTALPSVTGARRSMDDIIPFPGMGGSVARNVPPRTPISAPPPTGQTIRHGEVAGPWPQMQPPMPVGAAEMASRRGGQVAHGPPTARQAAQQEETAAKVGKGSKADDVAEEAGDAGKTADERGFLRRYGPKGAIGALGLGIVGAALGETLDDGKEGFDPEAVTDLPRRGAATDPAGEAREDVQASMSGYDDAFDDMDSYFDMLLDEQLQEHEARGAGLDRRLDVGDRYAAETQASMAANTATMQAQLDQFHRDMQEDMAALEGGDRAYGAPGSRAEQARLQTQVGREGSAQQNLMSGQQSALGELMAAQQSARPMQREEAHRRLDARMGDERREILKEQARAMMNARLGMVQDMARMQTQRQWDLEDREYAADTPVPSVERYPIVGDIRTQLLTTYGNEENIPPRISQDLNNFLATGDAYYLNNVSMLMQQYPKDWDKEPGALSGIGIPDRPSWYPEWAPTPFSVTVPKPWEGALPGV